MDESRISLALSPERSTATLALPPAGEQAATIDLTFDQVTGLIQALGRARAAMIQAHPERQDSLERMRVDAIVDPRWLTQPDALTEGSTLAFLHPQFGPVAFVLPSQEVERLVRALSLHLGMIRSSEGSKPS
ncbi:MAG TPA: hypothetical protein VME92_20605 [Acetobacteraceae bacterium]|nr:hypothetical protein [Acetobacteraceae bacterium]